MNFLRTFSLRGILALSLLSGILSAKAQITGSPAQPGYYSMQLGDFRVVALSDGTLPLNMRTLLHEAKKGEVNTLLQQNYLDTLVETSITAYLILNDDQQILVDAGSGSFLGPTLGKLQSRLAAVGISAEDIDAVLLTHLHVDHVGGLVNEGKVVFPNATLYISKPEADFWLTASNKATANKRAQPFFDLAQTSIKPYQQAGKVKTFAPGAQLLPGISAIPAVGHTPGHSFFVLESKGQKMVFWGDVIHVGAIQFADPTVTVDFDVDLAGASAARKWTFEDAVKQGYWIAAPHLSFPGIGHLRHVGKEYQWMPANYAEIFAGK